MVDYYAPERVVHLSNLVAAAFPVAEKISLRLETARIRDKEFYSLSVSKLYAFSDCIILRYHVFCFYSRRHMTDKTVPRNLSVFDLSIDALTYRVNIFIELQNLFCQNLLFHI